MSEFAQKFGKIDSPIFIAYLTFKYYLQNLTYLLYTFLVGIYFGRFWEDLTMRNNNEEFDNLGAQIKELRIQMKLTQAEVAEALNVTPGYISNVENNRTAMSLRILMYYAKLMNISLDSLIGRVEPEYRKTALDNELLELISKMSDQDKTKLIKTLKIWKA